MMNCDVFDLYCIAVKRCHSNTCTHTLHTCLTVLVCSHNTGGAVSSHILSIQACVIAPLHQHAAKQTVTRWRDFLQCQYASSNRDMSDAVTVCVILIQASSTVACFTRHTMVHLLYLQILQHITLHMAANFPSKAFPHQTCSCLALMLCFSHQNLRTAVFACRDNLRQPHTCYIAYITATPPVCTSALHCQDGPGVMPRLT
jgi:hypothetical protein